jgi:hypothetical protein
MMEDFLSALLESKHCDSANLVDDNARSNSSSSSSLHKTLPIKKSTFSSVPNKFKLSSNLPRRRSSEDRWTACSSDSDGQLSSSPWPVKRSPCSSSADSLLVAPTRRSSHTNELLLKDSTMLSHLDQSLDLMDDFWEKSSWSAVLEKKTNVPLQAMSLTPSSISLQNALSLQARKVSSMTKSVETADTTMKQALPPRRPARTSYPIDATSSVTLNKEQLEKLKSMAAVPAVELLKHKQQLQAGSPQSVTSPLLSNAFAASRPVVKKYGAQTA